MRTTVAGWQSPKAGEPQRGFTLIELMIAMAISLFLLIGVSSMLMFSSSSEKTNSAGSEISTNGRYALEVLRRDLLHAGYRGLSWAPSTPLSTTVIASVPGECSPLFAINIAQPIWGSNDSNPWTGNSPACIPAANYSVGDIFVTRHAALSPATSLDATTLYFRSAYERGEVFLGSNPPTLFTAVPVIDYALETSAYYVSPYTNSATESPKVPALYRLALGAGPAMAASLVASNVENMQVQYGRTTTDGKTRFQNADSISSTTTPSEWNDVSAVRIWLLVRGTTPEPGYSNTTTYSLGDKTITASDGFRREVFSTIVQLRNK